MTTKPISHSDYTIGWVCALPKEQTAALGLLDERHPDLPKPSRDDNTYILGSMNGHNVVIACLPKGKIGTNQAATVATRMVSTFQSVRIGLMVGIGGGIPPKVRLGDVVVSTPVDQHPGVVQWDMGKTEGGGKFRRTGALNSPPSIFLTAVGKLESTHELYGTKISEYLDAFKETFPQASAYVWNKSLKDPWPPKENVGALQAAFMLWTTLLAILSYLFGSWAFNSTNGEAKNSAKDSADNDRKPGQTRIHYGLIASGNQVIKDAKFRDSINNDLGGDVLCFEMEAAGLMSDFPCIVVRGICDYADSKKNKDWQEYAALVAAAYAKELLGHVQRSDIDKERPIRDVMVQALDEIKGINSRLGKKEDLEILNWLTNVDYGPRQSDILRTRQPGTGKWLLDSTEYQRWLTAENQILFCRGIPGAGKTVLASAIVDHLSTWFLDDETVGIAYIYCNFKEQNEQKIDHLLASLLKQLAQSQPSLPESVRKLFNEHKARRTKPPTDEIVRTLHLVISVYSNIFFVIDALDECREADNCRHVFISTLLQLHAKFKTVSILTTSRPIMSIEAEFKENPRIEIRAHEEDVRKYLASQTAQSTNTVVKKSEDLITDTILGTVDGMFLLAQLYFQSISTKTTLKIIKAVLSKLSCRKGGDAGAYEQAYDGAMERIESYDPDSKVLAKRVLSWVICAITPLTTLELQHALAVEVGEPKFDKENMPDINRMVSVCAGLITVDSDSKIIRLVHYTAQEYFDKHRITLFPSCQIDITNVCVTYLSYDIFQDGPCKTEELLERKLRGNPLYTYSASNWGHHARELETTCCSSPQTADLVLDFLKSSNKVSASSQAHTGFWQPFRYYGGTPRIVGLHLAAYFGLCEAVGKILSMGTEKELKDNWNRTPLYLAVEKGHEAVVRLLLDNGADKETKDGRYGQTPLYLAADEGY
ncbi:hypothetical protein TWF281_000827 [Arthrobotrys megalospora]